MATPTSADPTMTGRLILTFHHPELAHARVQRLGGPRRVHSTQGLSPEQAATWLRDAPLIEIGRAGVLVVDPADPTANQLALAAQEMHEVNVEPELVFGVSSTSSRSVSEEDSQADPPSPSGEEGCGAPLCVDDDELTWGARAVGCRPGGQVGLGARVALLGTGLDTDHPAFWGRAGAVSFVSGEDAHDFHGHGTHVAGTVAGKLAGGPVFGVAPGAELLVVKVMDVLGVGSSATVLAGLAWALEQRPQVVALPFGCPSSVRSLWSPAFERLTRAGLEAGSLTLAPAGEDSQRVGRRVAPVSAPGNCPSVLCVGMLSPRLGVCNTSNRGLVPQGGRVDLSAPGEAVLSTALGGGVEVRGGAGAAVAHAAGVAAALACTSPTLRGLALWRALEHWARPLPGQSSLDVGVGLVHL